jgi:hypothetical protein
MKSVLSRLTEVLRLAIARGELRATLDMDLALDFLAGRSPYGR